MRKNHLQALIISVLLMINLFTFISVSNTDVEAEDSFSTLSTTFNQTWYVAEGQQKVVANDELITKAIQVNTTGSLVWSKIKSNTTGTIQINTGGFFNVSDSWLNLTGDFIIEGNVSLVNVTLVMNNSFNGEFEIVVSGTGNLTAFNTTITSFDKTTPHNLGGRHETYGNHYNFSVELNGKLVLKDCTLNQIGGDPSIYSYNGGGVRIFSDDVLIERCTISEAELAGIFVFGDIQPIIKDSVIMNNTIFQVYAVSKAKPYFYNNVIKNSTKNGGYGVYLHLNADAVFVNNTIENITFYGMLLDWHSNATIENNTVRQIGSIGLYIVGAPGDMGATISNNHVHNNTFGIYLQPWYVTLTNNVVVGNLGGNITNNQVEYNNNTGIVVDNYAASLNFASTVNSTLFNNTVINNEAGIYLWHGDPFMYHNNASNNNFSGIYILEESNPVVKYNNANDNGRTGIIINTSSAPLLIDNIAQRNNNFGLLSINAEPFIALNNISSNNWSGILVDKFSTKFTISKNNITLNGQDGIYLNNTSPNILNSNRIEANYHNGIGIYNASDPMIRDNHIFNNLMNGIMVDGSSGRIIVNNNISWNRQNGIASYNGADPYVSGATIFQNHQSGVFSSSSSPRIIWSTVEDNLNYGVHSASGSSDHIENSSISNSGAFDYYLIGNTHPIIINSTYDKGSVDIGDATSDLKAQWFFNINVTNTANSPIGSCTVNITDQATSKLTWDGLTDGNGQVRFINTTKYTHTQSGITNSGPHTLLADTFLYAEVIQGPFSGEKTIWVDFQLPQNRIPDAGNFIGPKATHSTTPLLRWDPGFDFEGKQLKYNVRIGTTFDSENLLRRIGMTETQLSLPPNLIGHNSVESNRTYYISIAYDDSDGPLNTTHDQFYLVNNYPTTPGITLTPANATILDTITVTITTPSFDNDTNPTDDIRYTYNWYLDTVLIPGLTKANTVDLSAGIKNGDGGVNFNKHDRVKCVVRSTDGNLSSITASAEVQLANINPAVIKNFPEMTINEDEQLDKAFNLYDYFSDPDDYFGNPLTSTLKFRSSQSENLTITIDPYGDVHFVPAPNWHGTEKITFIAEDSDKESATSDLTFTVLSVNDLPRISKIGGKNVLIGSTTVFNIEENEKWVFLEVQVVDDDIARGESDKLFFEISTTKDVTLTPYPDDPLKATIAYLPNDDDVGSWTFSISVRDSEDNEIDSSANVKFIVSNVNDPPVITEIVHDDLKFNKSFSSSDNNKMVEFSGDLSAVEGKWFNFTLKYTDEDAGEIFEFDLDDKVRFKIETDTVEENTVEIHFLPSRTDIGKVTVLFTLQDRLFGSDTLEITIFVKNINDPPEALIYNPQSSQTFFKDTLIKFSGDVIDPDLNFGDVITFNWSSDKYGVFGRSMVVNFSELDLGWHEITFSVTDSGGLTDSATVKILINTIDDTDADGLNDDWEIEYFDDLKFYGPDDDPDLDGYTNIEEFEQGTDPTDPRSYPHAKSSEIDTSVILYGAILGVVLLIIGIVVFGYILKTQRKREVVGWDWVTDQTIHEGPVTTLPGYEAAKQVEAPKPSGQLPTPSPTPLPEAKPQLPPVVEAEVARPDKVDEHEVKNGSVKEKGEGE